MSNKFRNRYDWSLIQTAHDAGETYADIEKKFGVRPASMRKAIQTGKFHRTRENVRNRSAIEKSIDHINWSDVQKTYDSGLSIKETYRRHGINRYDIAKAIKWSLFIQRSFSDTMKIARREHPYKTSDATKETLRQTQLALIAIRPELSPAHYHSSKKSFPEKIFEDELNRRSIVGWIYNLPVWKYRFDFAFQELMVDVEVDGSSHLEPKVADKDRCRDEWSRENGWTVVRFTANQVKTDLVGCVDAVEKVLKLKRS